MVTLNSLAGVCSADIHTVGCTKRVKEELTVLSHCFSGDIQATAKLGMNGAVVAVS